MKYLMLIMLFSTAHAQEICEVEPDASVGAIHSTATSSLFDPTFIVAILLALSIIWIGDSLLKWKGLALQYMKENAMQKQEIDRLKEIANKTTSSRIIREFGPVKK